MSAMQVAFTTLACPGWSVDQVITAATAYGYGGVEWRLIDGEVIDPVEGHAALLDAVRRCRAAGLSVPAIDTSCRFNHAERAKREAEVATAYRWIALAAEAEVKVLRVFGGADPEGVDAQEATAWVVEALAACADEAEAAGVTLALETHDAFSSARRVAKVLDQVRSPAVAALWDSHHPYRVGESPAEVPALLGKHIVHVHVKDARRLSGDAWQLVELGQGEVPVREVLRALEEYGYRGAVALEWEKKWHTELAEPEAALPAQRQWLREQGL